MESESGSMDFQYKIREKVDYEQWIFEHLMEMTRVQSGGERKKYENMLNTLILSLSPYWPDGFKEKWEEIRKMHHPDPWNKINDERIEAKELLKAELIDKIGVGFTKKRKMQMKGGLLKLWEMYPPFPPSSERSSKS